MILSLRTLIFGLRQLILDLRKLSFGPERTDFKPGRAVLQSERVNLEPERSPGGDVFMDKRTNIWNFTRVLQDIGPLGRCLKSLSLSLPHNADIEWKYHDGSEIKEDENRRLFHIFSRVFCTYPPASNWSSQTPS